MWKAGNGQQECRQRMAESRFVLREEGLVIILVPGSCEKKKPAS